MKISESWISEPPMTLVFLCLIALWEAGVAVFSPSPLVLPAPSAIVATFISQPNVFLTNAWITLVNTLAGFALSVVIGVTLAVGIVYSRFLEATLFYFARHHEQRAEGRDGAVVCDLAGTGDHRK